LTPPILHRKTIVVTGTMYLPVNRQVDLRLRAVDVIHSFFVPNMRFKQDAVPGLEIHMHFTPTDWNYDADLRSRPLQNARHAEVVSQDDFRQVVWAARGRKTIWLPGRSRPARKRPARSCDSRSRGPDQLHSQYIFSWSEVHVDFEAGNRSCLKRMLGTKKAVDYVYGA